jgi:hypothetical protein
MPTETLQAYTACLSPRFSLKPSYEHQAAIVLDRLANVSSLVDATDSQSGQVYLKLRGYVASEFYRTEFDSRFEGAKLPRRRGNGYQGTKQLVADEVKLWSLTLRVLERLNTLGRLPLPYEVYPGYAPPVSPTLACFFALVMESEFLMNYAAWGEDGFILGQKDLFKHRQNQNAKTSGMAKEIPYHRPVTRLFLENAIAVSDRFDKFRTSLYHPMIKQRKAITARLMKEHAKVINAQGQPTRQGRKKSK